MTNVVPYIIGGSTISYDIQLSSLQTKYLTGLISTASNSVVSMGIGKAEANAVSFGGKLYCDCTLKVGLSNGSQMYIPLFAWGDSDDQGT